MFNPTKDLKNKILEKHGGFVNCHSHIDRAYTVRSENLNNECERFLTEKWRIVDEVKRLKTNEEYYKSMLYAFNMQRQRYGVTDICSFIDVDSVVELKAFDAAVKIRQELKEASESEKINIKLACQTLKGVLDKKERSLIEGVIDQFDIIGSLPAADSDIKKHLDVVMSWAKDTGKKLHIHVDQLNLPEEDETSIVLDMIPKYQLEGRVVCVHGISIASKLKAKRLEIYKKCVSNGVGFISCPSAWIDHRRSDELQPWHNATTPVEEMLEAGIPVGLGTDNICDIYKPFSSGDMMFELKTILESCHLYDMDKLINIATNKSLL